MIAAPSIEFWITLALLVPTTWFAVYKAGKHTVYVEVPREEEEYGDMEDTSQYAQEVLPLQERAHPDLVKRLREVAKRLGRERIGGITSADVIAALEVDDPTMHKRLQLVDRRLMGTVFQQEWMQTGEWRKTGSRGRPQPVWVLKGILNLTDPEETDTCSVVRGG